MNKRLFTFLFLILATLQINAQELNYGRRVISIPYVPIKIEGNTILLYGSKIELDKSGFPKQIANSTSLLYENIHFHFVRESDGKNMILKDGGLQFLKKTDRRVKWKSINQNDTLIMEVKGKLGLGGLIRVMVKVKALNAIELKDVTMHIPFTPTIANSMMGFGIAYGQRPEKVEWKWNGEHKYKHGAWLGNPTIGLEYTLRRGAWANRNKGGVTIGIKGSSMLANNYTGKHKMKKGDVLHYNFTLLVTSPHTQGK